MLFNFQGPRASNKFDARRAYFVSSRFIHRSELIYYITRFLVCQALFQIIFKILFHSNLINLRSAFLNFWLNHAVLRASRVAVSLTAHI